MALTTAQKRDLADRIKAHVASLLDTDGISDFCDEDGRVPSEVRAEVGRWMSRLPGDYWDSRAFGRRP